MVKSALLCRGAKLTSYLVVAGIFIWSAIFILLSTTILDGESVSVSNVPINYVLTGNWTYPFHAQDLFYPGVDKFIIHPPLHYYLVSIWVRLFGIGPWQLLWQSTFAGIAGILGASYFIRLKVGDGAAILTLALATIFAGLRHTMVSVRPDLSFGLVFAIVVLFSYLLLCNYKGRKGLVLSALVGVSIAASLAVHWYGYFVMLYFPAIALYLGWRLRKEAWKPILSLASGGGFVFLIWWYIFGNDFWFGALTILMKGNTFLEVLHIPFSHYLKFLTDWPGGGIVLVGCVFSIGFCCFEWLRATIVKRPVSRPVALATFLVLNIVLYELFFVFLVANKAPRYSANIAIILVPLSAIGYFLMIGQLGALFKKRKILANGGTLILSFVFLWLSPYATKTFSAANIASLSEKSLHSSIREGLFCGIPDDATILLGSSGYQYLYDRPYLTTMRLYAEEAIPQPSDWSLRGLIRYYRKGPGISYRTATIPYDTRQRSIGDRVNVMVNADSGHGWQNLYYNPLVWEGKFQEYLSVGLVDPKEFYNVSGRIARQPNVYLTVFLSDVNNKKLKNETRCSGVARGLHIIGNNVFLMRYDEEIREYRNLMADDWLAFSEDEKVNYMSRYLALLVGDTTRSDTILQRNASSTLVSWVNTQFERRTETVPDHHGGNRVRTFGQIVDRYFEKQGLVTVFKASVWETGQ